MHQHHLFLSATPLGGLWGFTLQMEYPRGPLAGTGAGQVDSRASGDVAGDELWRWKGPELVQPRAAHAR